MSDQSTPEQGTPTTFVKVTREQFDQVMRLGTPEFIKTLSKGSVERLEVASRWANERRSEKRKGVYLTFPVSTPKQQAAGRLYLQALSRFMQAVRAELGNRAMDGLILTPKAELATVGADASPADSDDLPNDLDA